MAKNNVVKIEEGKEKIQNIIITTQDFGPNNGDAYEYNYKEIVFNDVMGYQLNNEWVAVSLKNGDSIAIPRTEVRRIDIKNVNKD